MKRFFVLAALLFAIPCLAQYHFNAPSVNPEEDSLAIVRVRAKMDSIRQHRPTVAVVLGGGGALGMAHLGVLRYIEEMGIPVDMVGGTSMGGLVAGLYSLGYGASYLDSLVRAIDWTVMMSDKIPDSYQTYKVRRNKERFALTIPFHYDDEDIQSRIDRQIRNDKNYEQRDTRSGDMGKEMMAKIGLGLPDGFLFGFNVRNTLSSVSVGYQDSLAFDQLPLPFFCVATDMLSLNEKNWTSGNLVDAMRSTMAIPGYFRPVRLEGMVLVDGGTRNNFPVDLAHAMGADIIIGSEMPTHRDLSDLGNLANIAMQNITLLSADISVENRKYVDILLQHHLQGYNMLSFDAESVDDIIARGYALAVEKKAEFEEVARRLGTKPDSSENPESAHAVDIHKRKVQVSEVRYEGLSPKESEFIVSPALLPYDGMYGRDDIEQVLSVLYGTKAFESVTYRLTGSQAPYTLVFDCQKGQTHEAGVGIHADGDEGVYIAGFVGLGIRRLSGLRFVSELKLGQVSEVNLDLSYKPLGQLPVFGLALNNSYKNFSYWEDGGKTRYNGINTRGEVYFEDSRLIYSNIRLGFAAELEPYEYYLDQNMQWQGWDLRSRWFSTFANLRYDTFNESYFPTKGFRVSLNTRYVFDGFSIYMEDEDTEAGDSYEGDVPPYSVGMAHASFVLPFGSRLILQPSAYFGWQTEYPGRMSFMHTLTVGGTLAGRYMDNQLPYFGFNTGFQACGNYATSVQVDLRYRINHKSFFTLRTGMFQDKDKLAELVNTAPTAYAFGAEFGRKTPVGPLALGAQWCSLRGFSVAMSIGFNF